METRNTKQKEIILDIMLRHENMIHPTIQEITNFVMKENQGIGQATIYRNVNKLVKEGKLIKISTKDGFRYDINTDLHGHLVCRKCGRVYDLYDETYQKLVKELEGTYKVKIDTSNLIFDGLCSSCNKLN